jgi:nitric oxide reductase NorQ protein
MQIERLSAADYAPREGLVYVDTNNLHPLYEKLAFNANLILVGPKGVGKSLSVAAFCAEKKYPVITFDCSEDVRRAQLIGMFVLRGNETPFVLGPLSTAFEVANEAGHCVLILEEINALSPQMQKVLNSTTDFRKTIEVPEARRIFKLNPEAKLWVVGSMNTSAYGGVYSLNEDLKSRFRMLPVEYPKLTDERNVVTTVLSARSISVEKAVLDKVFTFAKETRQNATDYSLSTRDVVQIAEDIHLVGLNKALLLAMGKFEGSDREMLFERIRSIFGLSPKVLTD